MNKSGRLFLFLVLSFLVSGVYSQSNGILGSRFFSNWSMSLSGGPNIFFGDLKENNILPATSPINEIRFAGTFSLNRQLSYVFMLRAQVLYGEIAGEKLKYKDGTPCNQYFQGNILEYNLNTTINFSNLFGGHKPKRFFFVYGTLGLGVSTWISTSMDITTNEPIATSGSSSNRSIALVIPAGLGFYFSIKDKLNLGLEWTLRGVNSDKVDATVGGIPYDAYSLLAFNLTYNFNRRSGDKLSPASPQKQIGPPPPEPLLAAEIADEKQKEQAAKAMTSYPTLPPPLPVKDTLPPPQPVKDTLPPKQPILAPDTLPKEVVLPDTNIMEKPHQGISYRVQVFSFKDSTYNADQVKAKFKLSQTVTKEFSGGWYRYTIGPFTSPAEANKVITGLRNSKTIPDAFYVKYIDGKRVGTTGRGAKKHSTHPKGKIYFSKPKHKK